MNIDLPNPSNSNSQSLKQAIEHRRSCREFSNIPVKIDELSLLLWSAQGATGTNGQKSAPSAGAQYPMKIYVAAGNVERLASGTYQYDSQDHGLYLINKKDVRITLCEAALDQQPWVNDAAIVFVLAADFVAMQNHFHNQHLFFALRIKCCVDQLNPPHIADLQIYPECRGGNLVELEVGEES